MALEQFQDTNELFKSKAAYGRWFDKEKKNHLQTLSFNQILKMSDYGDNAGFTNGVTKTLTECGDSIYVPNPGLNNYSIYDFRYGLEQYLQPFVLMSLICTDVHFDYPEARQCIVGTRRGRETKLAVTLDTRRMYYITERTDSREIYFLGKDKLVPTKTSSAYEFVFKELGLPIRVVMNTVTPLCDSTVANSIIREIDLELLRIAQKAIASKDFMEANRTNDVYKSLIFKK